MTDVNKNRTEMAGQREHRCRFPIVAVVAVAASGLVAVALVLVRDLPPFLLASVPLAFAAAIALLWSSHWALCFVAFAITPLNVLQYELFGVTLNLPEALILALAGKEALRIILGRERLTSLLPLPALVLYGTAAVVGIATGIAHRNGLVRVLQDFRQFTEFILLFWLVLQKVTTRRQAFQIALCYVAGATLIAIHGIVQHYLPIGVSPTQIASDLALYKQVRSGSFYGATTLGGLMVLAVGPAAGLAISTERRSVRLVLVICIILCLIAAVYTKTRASWMAMAFLLLLMALALRPSVRTVGVVAAVALVLAAAMGPSIARRLSTLSDPHMDRSFMGRAQYYTAAGHIARAHPILGLGWGCYYDSDKILAAERYVATPRPPDARDATVHSAYLQLLVKTGLFGLLSFLVIALVWVERIWRTRDLVASHDRRDALFVGVSAGVAGYLAHSALENFFQWPVMAQSLWLLLGLSFAMAHWAESRKPSYRGPMVLVGSGAALFLSFVYAATWLETSDPGRFEQNYANAVQEGNMQKAFEIAQRAPLVNPFDPMAHTIYGRALLERGDEVGALDSLNQAVMLRKDSSARRRETRRPYYFAPARLTLGKYYLEHGRPLEALRSFELARAYDVPADEKYEQFHAALYQAYAQQGLWARALEFGEPSETELDGMGGEALAAVARVCEGSRDWTLAHEVAERLAKLPGFEVEAQYILGRTFLAQNLYEESLVHLQQAASSGRVQAAYYLGAAYERAGQLDQAIQAYVSSRTDDPYRLFALAKALALVSAASGNDRRGATATPEELRHELGAELARMQALPQPSGRDGQHRLTPLSFAVSDTYRASGGRFPVVVRWRDEQVRDAPLTCTSLPSSGKEEPILLLRTGDNVLQLQWVENQVYWQGVERLRLGDGPVPGWTDTARDWFGARSDYAVRIEHGEDGDPFLTLVKATWLNSVPVEIHDGGGLSTRGPLQRRPRQGLLRLAIRG